MCWVRCRRLGAGLWRPTRFLCTCCGVRSPGLEVGDGILREKFLSWCSLPSFSWISSVQPLGLIQRQGWEGSQVTSPLLTKTETEAQAGEMTSSRSCGQLGMEVERELELADCQLIFFPERKLGSGILGQGGRSRWAMSFSSPNPDGVELYSGPSCSSPLPPGFPQI